MQTTVSIYRTDPQQVAEFGRPAFQGMNFRGILCGPLISYTRQLAENSGITNPEIVCGTLYEPADNKRHVLAGRSFTVLADFPDTSAGERAANYYMSIVPGAGVLEVTRDGLVVIAANADKGVDVGFTKRLTCCCCGAATIGRQWHNRDAGFGICMSCIESSYRDYTPERIRDLHGDRGVHYGLEE